MYIYIYIYIYTYILGSSALRARRSLQDYILGLYFGIILRDNIVELCYGIVIQDNYGIISRDYITG